jgi:hypothetical protein
MSPCRVASSLVSLALVGLVSAQAPIGFKTFGNKVRGLTFIYPSAYQEMPLPPTEQVLVARYVMKDKPAELEGLDDRVFRAMPPELVVFEFQLAAPVTGATAKQGEPAPPPDTLREAMEAQNRVGSWDQFQKRLAGWTLSEDPKKPGHFMMSPAQQDPGGRWPARTGYLIRKQEGARIFGVYAVHFASASKQLPTLMQKVGNSLKQVADEVGEAAEAAIDSLYASGRYGAVAARKQARASMPAGWKALDTTNYLIIHHSKNDLLVKRIARDIEAMRALYTELFPPAGPMDRLAIVRICRTKDEYHQYGGPPTSGGFWHPGNEELVFFDYSYTMKAMDEEQRKAYEKAKVKLTNDDSLLVLYHEAFHQYIHYAIGEFAPHDWFNEGYGDYFSGAEVADNGRVLRVEPSPWRIHLAKDICEFGEGSLTLQKILTAERAEFYNPSRQAHYYAGAWSFLFFLLQSKEAKAHPQWSRLLATYLGSIKQAYRDELGKLGGDKATLEHKQVASFNARKVALAAMLDGIDLPALEAAWKRWVIELKDPWPSKRKKRK